MISKVLMVDDEPHMRKIGAISLTAVGKMEVVMASSGAEAIEIAIAERPDVILLDVMMPGMDGPTTLAALRARLETKEIPVVFMTARAQKDDVDRYLALGAVGVIVKPFDPMTLPDEVRRLGAPR